MGIKITAGTVVEKARRLIGDQDGQIYTDEECLSMIDELMIELTENFPINRQRIDIQIVEGERDYQFPDGLISCERIFIENLDGREIPMMNYQNLVEQGVEPFGGTGFFGYWNGTNDPNDYPVPEGFPEYYYREHSDANGFRLGAVPLAETIENIIKPTEWSA